MEGLWHTHEQERIEEGQDHGERSWRHFNSYYFYFIKTSKVFKIIFFVSNSLKQLIDRTPRCCYTSHD